MKRLVLLLMLATFVVAMMGACGGPPKEVVPPSLVDTTPPPPPVDTTPPPPPPPPPVLQATQLQTVYFDFDKHNLRADAKAALDADFALMQEFPDAIVKIEGHCDERGTIEYNLSLGEKRAKAVMDYLVGQGIAPARLSVISFGKERPADTGHNDAAWNKNRRAEFRIISQ